MTFVTALAVLDSMVDADPPIERAALELDRLTAEPERSADEMCAWIDGRPNLALVGRGSARAAAEMGALTLKEAARMPAESLQAAQFRHGPLELAGPKLAVIVIATEPAHPRPGARAGRRAGAGGRGRARDQPGRRGAGRRAGDLGRAARRAVWRRPPPPSPPSCWPGGWRVARADAGRVRPGREGDHP